MRTLRARNIYGDVVLEEKIRDDREYAFTVQDPHVVIGVSGMQLDEDNPYRLFYRKFVELFDNPNMMDRDILRQLTDYEKEIGLLE